MLSAAFALGQQSCRRSALQLVRGSGLNNLFIFFGDERIFSNSNVVLKHERRGACSWHPVFGINTIYEIYETTLSGGSLGSCVDEERSQLRELM